MGGRRLGDGLEEPSLFVLWVCCFRDGRGSRVGILGHREGGVLGEGLVCCLLRDLMSSDELWCMCD